MERRYSSVFLAISVFVLLTLSVVGCGGGGDDDSKSTTSNPTATNTTPTVQTRSYSTGNQDFSLEALQAKDPLSGFRIGAPAGQNLPTNKDYTNNMPNRIGNQGQTGSCTAFATGYYMKSYQEAKEEGWDINQNLFSPMYLFSMQCKDTSFPYDFTVSHKILKKNGCAKEATLPYQDFDGNPARYAAFQIPDKAHTEAFNYRSGEYRYFKSLDEIKQALLQGPVILGINYYSGDLGNVSEENNYLTFDPSKYDMGHAVLCIGYDDTKFGVGALKFINSWGADWGIRGYSWIRYSDVNLSSNPTRIVNTALTIDDLPNPKPGGDKKPDAPTNVKASDDEGSYVDIQWNKVQTALSYKVIRQQVDNMQNWLVAGETQFATFRDNSAESGVDYYYYVKAVNDVGESDYSVPDTGRAKRSAKELLTPILKWTGNSNMESNFEISNLDPSATGVHISVIISEKGQWESFGWIQPQKNFPIRWDETSKYVGQQPWVVIHISDGINYAVSAPIQIGQPIPSNITLAKINAFTATSENGTISLSWTTDGGKADYFEIWRYRYTGSSSEWVSLGFVAGNYRSAYDSTALKGVFYYYAVQAQYNGMRGEYAVALGDPVIIIAGNSNLMLYNINCPLGMVSNYSVSCELMVANTGNTTISDYQIGIEAYDVNSQQGSWVNIVNASSFATSLPSGTGYTLTIPFDIPKSYSGIYRWAIVIDPSNNIQELLEDDNIIWSDQTWWLNPVATRERKAINSEQSVTVSPMRFKRPEPAMKY